MNKLVRNTGLVAIGALAFQSCQKDYYLEDLDAANASLKEFQQAHLFAVATIVDLNKQLDEAQAQIDANLVTIDNLEIKVGGLSNQVLVLQTENARLEQVVADLLIDVARLEQTIIDFENEVIRINNLLVIEQQKTNANNEVIETLENELAVKQAEYDSLVANPIVITEVRYEIVETIIETQQEFSDDQYNALYLGVNEIQGLLNGVIANLKGDIDGAQEELAIAESEEARLFSDFSALALASNGSRTIALTDAQNAWERAKQQTEEITIRITSLTQALSRMDESNRRINELLNNG